MAGHFAKVFDEAFNKLISELVLLEMDFGSIFLPSIHIHIHIHIHINVHVHTHIHFHFHIYIHIHIHNYNYNDNYIHISGLL
jgi:hypothetical protein